MKTSLEGLSELDQGVLECLDALEGRCKQCAKSALTHLEKAERIVDIDSEMTVFRAITAEEEAAAGVFYAVRQLGYPNSTLLNPRDHVHKNALIPFLFAVSKFLGSTIPPSPATYLVVKDEGAQKRLTIKLKFPDGRFGEPVPPLNISIYGEADERRVRFQTELAQIAEFEGKSSVKKYLLEAANLRNLILYADDEGVPEVRTGVRAGLDLARWRVFILLRAMCLIFPYKEQALFVQQLIDGFLIAVGSIKEDDLDW